MNNDGIGTAHKGLLSIHFTLAQVVALLGGIARRDPDRIGADGGHGCIYAVQEGNVLTPVCIVGQMFADLGLLRLLTFNPNDLDYPQMLGACGVDSEFWHVLAQYGITADEDAKAFAHSVQSRQDDRMPWGDAFASAVQSYREQEQETLNRRLDNLFG